MDYKKLSDAIRLCGSTPKIQECKENCPYYSDGDMTKCIPKMTKDAADAISKIHVFEKNASNKLGINSYKNNSENQYCKLVDVNIAKQELWKLSDLVMKKFKIFGGKNRNEIEFRLSISEDIGDSVRNIEHHSI